MMTGTNDEALDFNSVQRGNAEMQRRCQGVINACAAMGKKNPSLDLSRISLPAVVPGLTAGISFIGDLFFDESATLILSDPSWDNYSLVFADRRGAALARSSAGSRPSLQACTLRELASHATCGSSSPRACNCW